MRNTLIATAALIAVSGCSTLAPADPAVQAAPSSKLGNYRFDYRIERKASDELVQVFDDGNATTILQFRNAPATNFVITVPGDGPAPSWTSQGLQYVRLQGIYKSLTVQIGERQIRVVNLNGVDVSPDTYRPNAPAQPSRNTPAERSGLAVVAATPTIQPTAPATSGQPAITLREDVSALKAELAQARADLAELRSGIRQTAALIHFADNSARMAGLPITVQKALAGMQPGQKILLAGYTDANTLTLGGSRLARARAMAVKSALVAAGVPAKDIRVRYWGCGHNVADNTTEEGRRENRRVEMLFANV